MKKGFTLVETLVVISIIILLTTIALPSYKSGQRQLALSRSANKMAHEIRGAQEMAMSARKHEGSVPPGGYGVYFEKYTDDGSVNYDIYLYADSDGDETYDSGEEVRAIYNESLEIYLESEVKIKEVKINSSQPDETSINFRPPDPFIKIKDGGGVDHQEAIITLALKADESKTKVVTVNKAGLIDVE